MGMGMPKKGRSSEHTVACRRYSARPMAQVGSLEFLVSLRDLWDGKVISLFAGGDKDIGVNCGALAFGVTKGLGQSRLFVVDTEQTRTGPGKDTDCARLLAPVQGARQQAYKPL